MTLARESSDYLDLVAAKMVAAPHNCFFKLPQYEFQYKDNCRDDDGGSSSGFISFCLWAGYI